MEPSSNALLVERTYTVELDLPIFVDLYLDMRRFLEAVRVLVVEDMADSREFLARKIHFSEQKINQLLAKIERL
jgi:hypothetical protein